METAARTLVRSAGLVGGFVADSHAMPAHWYYNVSDIPKAFGEKGLTASGFQAPDLRTTHPFYQYWENWMLLADAKGLEESGGKQVVGEVILRKTGVNWGPQRSNPHCSLPAGGTTTNANCARLMMRYLTSTKGAGYKKADWLETYVSFMTDPDQKENDDAYAEGYHTNFFKKLAAGTTADQCADTSSGSAAVGSLGTFPALIVYELARDGNVERVKAVAKEHLTTCAPHDSMIVVVDALVDLIDALAFKRPLKEGKEDAEYCKAALAKALAVQGHDLEEVLRIGAADDTEVVGGKFGSNCGIEASWPCVFFLVAKYALREVKRGEKNNAALDAIVANTNVGGENVHRGFLVGVLAAMVAPNSDAFLDTKGGLVSKLVWSEKIVGEVTNLLARDT